MRNSFIHSILLFVFLIFPTENIKAQKQLLIPSFLDNGKTIDSLKKIYNAEAITYEKWDKNSSDSCLNVCLINSTNVPLGIEAGVQLKNIAATIKKTLINSKNYKSIYIIFVKKEYLNGMNIRTHTNGMEVLMSEI